MQPAPLYEDVAQGPAGGEAFWLTTADGVRIRAAAWPAAAGGPTHGTVLLFPGRTEYIEKYGTTASDFAARGYGVVTVDWRGQGLADRATDDPKLGHVVDFDEFQRDIDAVVNLAQWLELPEPWFLIGHSMGGCIGLRALHKGLDVRAAAFSAPMWGMEIAPHVRPIAWISAFVGHATGFGKTRAPGTDADAYPIDNPFEDNTLTTDPEMFALMKRQVTTYPALALGGPTLSWLRASFLETTRLMRKPAPQTPTVTFLGTHERIVDPRAIHRLKARWANGQLEMVDGAEHEILMERAEVRTRFSDTATALFERTAQS